MHGYIFIRLINPTQWVSQLNQTEHNNMSAFIKIFSSLCVNSVKTIGLQSRHQCLPREWTILQRQALTKPAI